MLLSQALQSFDLSLTGVASPKTREWYASILRSLIAFLGDVELSAVSLVDLRRWRVYLIKSGLSIWTVHGYLRGVRRWFNWLVEEGELAASPAVRLALPRLPDEPPKGITDGDLALMIRAGRLSGARDYALVLFLADTGCRVGGLCGLRVEDVDLDRKRAIVREKGAGGNGKSRAVFYGEETALALAEWLSVRPNQADRVFIGRLGPLTRSGVYQVLKRLASTAGVTGRWNPHAFRHGWARAALQNGADLATVSQIMGHSTVEVTARFYGRFAETELARAHARFGRLRDK